MGKLPDLELEKRRFAICQRLVEVTQALIEQNKNQAKETVERTPEIESLKENQQETDPWDNHTMNMETKHQGQRELDNRVVADTED